MHGPARRRLSYLFPAIVAFAVLEFWLIVKVGVRIGAGQTLLLIICGSVLGIVLVKTQWRGIAGRMQAQVAAGIMPSNVLGDTLGLLLAGVLLIIPGFITDVAGLVLMLPFVRHAAAKYMLKRVPLSGQGGWPGFGSGFTVHSWTFDRGRTTSTGMHSSESGENIVEAEFEEIVREGDTDNAIDVTPREPDSSRRN
jgi:UPF0716 protein FxsA